MEKDREARMWSSIKSRFLNNKKLIIVTFEIFWIIVFLLEKFGSGKGVEIPQFIYVNF